MKPKASRFKTNPSWETWLKSAIRQKALVNPLAKVSLCKVGSSLNCCMCSNILWPFYLVPYSATVHRCIDIFPAETPGELHHCRSPHFAIAVRHHGSCMFRCYCFSKGKHISDNIKTRIQILFLLCLEFPASLQQIFQGCLGMSSKMIQDQQPSLPPCQTHW